MIRKGLAFQRIERIFITHLHGDHFYGLPGLLAMLSMKKIEHPVEVFGPTGIKNLLDAIFTTSQLYINYKLDVIELTEAQNLGIRGDWQIDACPIVHRVPCFGFVFKENILGTFDSSLALAKGVPKGALLGKLSSGTDVKLEDGTIVRRDDCLVIFSTLFLFTLYNVLYIVPFQKIRGISEISSYF